MSLTSNCPKCEKQVIVPDGVAADAVVRCPLCLAEYVVHEALANLPPMLIVVSPAAATGAEGSGSPEPAENPTAGQPFAFGEAAAGEAAGSEAVAPEAAAGEAAVLETAVSEAAGAADEAAWLSAIGEEPAETAAAHGDAPAIQFYAVDALPEGLGLGSDEPLDMGVGLVPSGSTKGQEPQNTQLWSDTPVRVEPGHEGGGEAPGEGSLAAQPTTDLPAGEHRVEASADEEAFSFSDDQWAGVGPVPASTAEAPIGAHLWSDDAAPDAVAFVEEKTDEAIGAHLWSDVPVDAGLQGEAGSEAAGGTPPAEGPAAGGPPPEAAEEDDGVPFAADEAAMQPVDLAAMTRQSRTPVAAPAGSPAAARPKKKRKKQETNWLARMLGMMICGPLAVAFLFLVGSIFREDVDVWHMFHKNPAAVRHSQQLAAKPSEETLPQPAANFTAAAQLEPQPVATPAAPAAPEAQVAAPPKADAPATPQVQPAAAQRKPAKHAKPKVNEEVDAGDNPDAEPKFDPLAMDSPKASPFAPTELKVQPLAVKVAAKPTATASAPKPEPKPEAKPEANPAAAMAPAPKPAVAIGTEPEHRPKPTTKPVVEPAAKAVAKAEPKSIARSETKPVTKAAPKPVAKSEVTPAEPAAPAGKAEVAMLASVGPRNAPSFNVAALRKAVRDAGRLYGCPACDSTGLMTKGTRQVPCEVCKGKPSTEISEEAYKQFCRLAEVVTYTGDDAGPQKGAIRLLAQRIAATADGPQTLVADARKLLEDPAKAKGGIVLIGTVTKVAARAGLQGAAVRLDAASEPVMVMSTGKLGIRENDRVVIFGALIPQPAKNLAGYQGTKPLVVWCGLSVKVGSGE
jgi:hypothetical protein